MSEEGNALTPHHHPHALTSVAEEQDGSEFFVTAVCFFATLVVSGIFVLMFSKAPGKDAPLIAMVGIGLFGMNVALDFLKPPMRRAARRARRLGLATSVSLVHIARLLPS